MHNNGLKVVTWATAAALGAGATQAYASAFQLMEQNASGLGNAYAGQAASAQDASTIFFNPAGMTRLAGKNAVGALHLIIPRAEFTNTGSTTAPLQTRLGGNGGDAGDPALVPNQYFSWQVMPELFVGLGITVPFGLKTEYDPSWVGRFHAVKSELKTLNINPSIAYKISDELSVGAGISYQRAEATLSNSVNYSAAAGGALGANAEGLATVKGHDGAWGYNVGVMLALSPSTRLGASYRSATDYNIRGDATFVNRPASLAAAIPNGPVTAEVKLPATATVALFHRVNRQWDLLADVSWTGWDSLQTLNIRRTSGALLSTTPLNWDNTWRVGLGVNYHQNAAWTWRFGVAYDQSPVPDEDRTPRIPDNDRFWLAVGAQYRLSRALAFDVGYAHIFVKNSNVNLCNPVQAAANPPACAGKNNLVGNYDDNAVDILSAQMRYAF